MAILEVNGTRSLFDLAIAISSIDQSYGYTIEFDINRGIKHHDILTLTDLVEDFCNYWRKNQATLHFTTAKVVQFTGDNRPTKEQQLCQCRMTYTARNCYYQNPFTRLEGQSGKLEIFDKINQRLDQINNKPFKQLVLESQKYNSFEKAKEDKEEQLIDLGGTDTNFTPCRNLGAFFASSHLTLPKKRLHRDEVLKPLKGYNAILKHSYLTEYQRAIFEEFTSLLDCGTFEYKEHSNEKLVPLM